MNKEIAGRLAALRKEMKREGIDYYMIPTSDFHNSEYVNDYFKVREYFSGFTGSNGTLAVGHKEAGLWTDGRYFIQAQRELEGTGIALFRMQEEGVPELSDYLYEQMEPGQSLGFDGRVVNCREGRRLTKKLSEKKFADEPVVIRYEQDVAGRVWFNRPALPVHEVMILPEEICGMSTRDKLTAVRKKMQEAGVEYLLLGRLDDLMWLLNIRGRDIECNPVAMSYGFVTRQEMYFFIQRQEVTPEFEAYAKDNGIILKDYEEIERFLSQYQYTGRVLADERNLSYALLKCISTRAEYISAASPTELMKAVKNPTELVHIKEVYRKDSAACIKFIYWLKHNIGQQAITEAAAAEHLDNLRREIDGFIELSFPTISAYQENAAMMHYEAAEGGGKLLSAEGALLVDSGGQYLGGTTDVTRTIVLGRVSEEFKKHFTLAAVGMLRLSAAKFLYGCTGRNLDILARLPLWNIGIDYKCGTGHGIGYILNVHEGPQSIRWRYVPGISETVIEENMLLSNEPGVYIEGKYGIRTENILAAAKGEKNGDGQFMHFDTLTYVPIDREAIDTAYMQPEDVKLLNRYHQAVYEQTEQYLSEEERIWLAQETAPIRIQE